ncbi:MAG: uroporphyrinogen-III C-methyltransferase [Bacillota bacterium]
MAAGIVYLVGAGPGDPELVTVKALRIIQTADVLVYDRLVSPALVAQSRPDAERIYVGKEAGRHGRKQAEISRLLLERALAGKTVCRLKGGDPFVFGRGAEEAEVLQAAGVEYRVVPGVTAAVAAAAHAGIPVTHRERSGSVALVTGHDACTGRAAVEWEHLARGAGTLCIYMGIESLAATAARLIGLGRPPETPVAVVRWGTTAEQLTVTGTLATIASLVERAGIRPPAMVVVGEVVALRERLAWAERLPLHGRRLLLPLLGPAEPAWVEPFRRRGAELWEWPLAPATAHLLREAITGGAVGAVLLPTPAVAAEFARLAGVVLEQAPGLLLAALGEESATAARAGGLHPALTAPTSEEVAEAMARLTLLEAAPA